MPGASLHQWKLDCGSTTFQLPVGQPCLQCAGDTFDSQAMVGRSQTFLQGNLKPDQRSLSARQVKKNLMSLQNVNSYILF
jgi:hypothetical protein